MLERDFIRCETPTTYPITLRHCVDRTHVLVESIYNAYRDGCERQACVWPTDITLANLHIESFDPNVPHANVNGCRCGAVSSDQPKSSSGDSGYSATYTVARTARFSDFAVGCVTANAAVNVTATRPIHLYAIIWAPSISITIH